jgi:hypothetical protein
MTLKANRVYMRESLQKRYIPQLLGKSHQHTSLGGMLGSAMPSKRLLDDQGKSAIVCCLQLVHSWSRMTSGLFLCTDGLPVWQDLRVHLSASSHSERISILSVILTENKRVNGVE